MKVRGIAWTTTKTRRYEEMRAFARDVLGLESYYEEPDFSLFRCEDGDTFEVTGPGSPIFESGAPGERQVICFLVEDVDAARVELEGKGVEFIGPVNEAPETGNRFTFFQAPDGHVYELATIPSLLENRGT